MLRGDQARRGGSGCSTGTTPPAVEKSHAEGFCAITGGYVVRDPGLPTLFGRYLYGDACVAGLRAVEVTGAGDTLAGVSVAALSSLGEDACGRLLAVSLNGPVYRIVDGAASACPPPVTTPPPSPPAPVAPTDTRACSVSARVSGLRSVRRLRRLTLTLRADEPCRATVSARIRGVATFRSTARTLGSGKRHVVRVS